MSEEFGFVFIMIAVFLMGCLLGQGITKHDYRMCAINRGDTEYVVDPLDGDTEFQWKTNVLDNASSM